MIAENRIRTAESSPLSALRPLRLITLASPFVLVLIASSNGCGGSSTPSMTAGNTADAAATSDDGGATSGEAGDDDASSGDDAAEASVLSNGAPSTTYPAFPVDVVQVRDWGGSVLAAPVIVTVTWSTDPDADTYNAFGDTIGASTYWSDINSEYGVGPATSGTANHVSITTPPPASYADTDLDNLVDTMAGTSWPAPTANTIYALYLPPNVGLTSGGQDECSQGIGGYHTQSQSMGLVYAIMPHCSGFQTADIEDSASHELNEASTDPHPDGARAYVGFDANHLAYEFLNQFQDELGDACEFERTANDTTDFTPYTVQRQWSNKSAAAGSQWCLPKLAGPFFNTTFIPATKPDTLLVNLGMISEGGARESEGFQVPLNTSRTFPIGFFSDAATNGPMTLAVQGLNQPLGYDTSGNPIANGTATVTLDLTSGVNGQIANVTVTPTKYSTLGIIYFSIRATLTGSQLHNSLPILIGLH